MDRFLLFVNEQVGNGAMVKESMGVDSDGTPHVASCQHSLFFLFSLFFPSLALFLYSRPLMAYPFHWDLMSPFALFKHVDSPRLFAHLVNRNLLVAYASASAPRLQISLPALPEAPVRAPSFPLIQ